MRKRNKLFLALSIAFLVLFAVACNDDTTDSTSPTDVDVLPTEAATDGNTGMLAGGAEITLTYANWNLGTEEENNIERQMVQAFMDAHPNVTIEIDESVVPGETPWDELLAIAASTGDLPDVFMLPDVGVALNSGWLLDVSDLANADTEFTALPDNMRDAMSFNGRVYTIPFAQHMQGFFVNRTLFDELNLDAPTHGFSVNDFEEAIRAVSDLNAPRLGVNTLNYMPVWYPGAVNEDLGFFTFDGENFHLDASEMIDAIRLANEWNANGFAWYGIEEEQRENFNGGWHGEVFWNGQIGLFWDGTWASQNMAEQADFEWDFVGVPGGRPVLIVDILGIAATTEHAEAAYAFATWMGSGTAGFTRRMELATEAGEIVSALPITADQGVLSTYWEMLGVPGIVEAYNNMDRALIDWNKITPGWVESRFYAPTGVTIGDHDNAPLVDFLGAAMNGEVNYADYASRINEIVQETFDNIQATID